MASFDERLCLQWNDFKENVSSAFGDLREDKDFTNVTLAPGPRIVPSCHPGWGAVSDLGGSFAERGFKIGHRHCGTTTRAIKTAPFN